MMYKLCLKCLYILHGYFSRENEEKCLYEHVSANIVIVVKPPLSPKFSPLGFHLQGHFKTPSSFSSK
jgi:hypothetical protein